MRRLGAFAAVAVWIVYGWSGPILAAEGAGSVQELRFAREDAESKTLSLAVLLEGCESMMVEVDDPYHGRRMRYVGVALGCVLDLGFSEIGGARALASEGLLLRALDGYTRPVSGRKLLEPGGILAYGEPDRMAMGASTSRFTPIDRRQVDPAPFYLVWTGGEQSDPHDLPWPYQLATIEIAPFQSAFPHTVPTGLDAQDPGWAGYSLFQEACASCHAINGEGGTIGPDLNVPRSIVEYRPLAQIRAYVRNPEAFRYTSMPAHPGLSEADLDALVAYFSAMRERKSDPRARGGS